MNIFVYLKDKEELEIIYKIVEENNNINFYIAIESINEDDFLENHYLKKKIHITIH